MTGFISNFCIDKIICIFFYNIFFIKIHFTISCDIVSLRPPDLDSFQETPLIAASGPNHPGNGLALAALSGFIQKIAD